VDPVKAVLTHHWLVRRRGGEKVLEALAGLLPDDTPVYTLVFDESWDPERQSPRQGKAVHSSMLQRVPRIERIYPSLLPLLPLAAWLVRLPRADLVVCSDASVAKLMRPRRDSVVVCYCHSPMRYAWEAPVARAYGESLPRPLRPFWPALRAGLRWADSRGARRVDVWVANSATVADRIRRAYGREARVVFPPVDVPAGPPARPAEQADFYLCVGHHVPYKRLDLALEACARLGRELVVIGNGPSVPEDRSRYPNVRFLGHQPDDVLRDHYLRARGLLFPGEEDFGIVPVEAIAHGCPVIAFGTGGAAETVVDGVSGVHFHEQSAEALADAIVRRETLEFDPDVMWQSAARFREDRFCQEMRSVLDEALQQRRQPCA
jgi:glycosyltransferase involved in cell wall biosynthesis